MLNSTVRIALIAALVILGVMAGLIYAVVPPPVEESKDRITLALVERDMNQLLSIKPVFVFYASGRAVFIDSGENSGESSAPSLPKYQTVANIDRTALMRDLSDYAAFAKLNNSYVISEPEDPRGLVFMICESTECKKIFITGDPANCRRRPSDCNLGLLPPELRKAIEYLADFVHPDAENYPLPKIEVVFTPKSKEDANGSFGRTTRGLPIPLVEWPADWPGLPAAPGADGKFHIMIDAANYPKFVELCRGLKVEDFGVVREGLLSIRGRTGLPAVAIPLPGVESWPKN